MFLTSAPAILPPRAAHVPNGNGAGRGGKAHRPPAVLRPVAVSAARRRSELAGLRADPRQAVQHDSIRCLVCGAEFRQLTNTHLRAHRLTADQYKRRFGYNRGRPLMCRALHALYANRAVETGLAAQIRQRPILVRPELRRRGGAREIALEELLTRREVRERARKVSLPL
ncbi:MAG TPA: MucR family transcriptional regulator [Methylomirabilota bacterium]|nr:MucR family transcriptional regulator [Methylomirabilota bacterium]